MLTRRKWLYAPVCFVLGHPVIHLHLRVSEPSTGVLGPSQYYRVCRRCKRVWGC